QRSGTENMAGIAALGAVLAALEEGDVFRSHGALSAYRDRLADALREAFPGIVFNAPFEHALPTTINFSVPGLASRDLLDLFDAAGVRVSAGSACSAAKAAPSYVLMAMGLPEERAASAVRMSFGPQVDEAFIDEACARIASAGKALRATALAPLPHHDDAGVGLYQLSAEGRSGWLLFDAQDASCVAIDPPAPLVPRLAALVRSHGYGLRAVVGTGADPLFCRAHAALGAELGALPGSDDPAWPWAGDSVRLGDGATVPCVPIGRGVLAKVVDGDRASYLFGVPQQDELPATAVRYAFTGSAAAPGCAGNLTSSRLREAVQRLAMIINAGTLLCGASDEQGIPCTTTAALAQGRDELAALVALQPLLSRSAPPGMGSVADLAPHALERFLQTHPDAILVDVREPAEHAARAATLHGRAVVSVPLTRLAEQAAHWLRGEPKPLVLFCRSGNRSARAVHCLHRLGYPQAWHVAGGLALAQTN
ncbi:MAG TPA: aminotransferase class V-fold PLP-dependent enzyme, partial [Telluria sp.]|nr:aminotransferase class V-fold PLP-dependent enzyme [Telluria sp.]